MVGKATAEKLRQLNINNIGDLAKYDLEIIKYKFKKHGVLIWEYANGIDESTVEQNRYEKIKGIGNSMTIPSDVKDRKTAYNILASLVETVAMRLRDSKSLCSSVSVSIKNNLFQKYSHQKKLSYSTNSTERILKISKDLFDEMWKGDHIRLLGIRVGHLCSDRTAQVSFFDNDGIEKSMILDKTIDDLKTKYGKNSIIRPSILSLDKNKKIK
nr:hypothetical protein [Clostridium aestuarii]